MSCNCVFHYFARYTLYMQNTTHLSRYNCICRKKRHRLEAHAEARQVERRSAQTLQNNLNRQKMVLQNQINGFFSQWGAQNQRLFSMPLCLQICHSQLLSTSASNSLPPFIILHKPNSKYPQKQTKLSSISRVFEGSLIEPQPPWKPPVHRSPLFLGSTILSSLNA